LLPDNVAGSPTMLPVFLVVGWVIALGCLLFLAAETAGKRLRKAPLGKTDSHNRAGWRRHFAAKAPPPAFLDTAAAPEARASKEERRGLRVLGYAALFVWEIYWLSEVYERLTTSANPWQLPYVMLLIVLVGIPLAVYFLARRMLA
jgi:hypothetical protein